MTRPKDARPMQTHQPSPWKFLRAMRWSRLLTASFFGVILLGYGDEARKDFHRWFNSPGKYSELQCTALAFVFDRWLSILDETRKDSRSDWKDSETVWLPLQYGLRPDQYATRDSLNRVIERVLDEPGKKNAR